MAACGAGRCGARPVPPERRAEPRRSMHGLAAVARFAEEQHHEQRDVERARPQKRACVPHGTTRRRCRCRGVDTAKRCGRVPLIPLSGASLPVVRPRRARRGPWPSEPGRSAASGRARRPPRDHRGDDVQPVHRLDEHLGLQSAGRWRTSPRTHPPGRAEHGHVRARAIIAARSAPSWAWVLVTIAVSTASPSAAVVRCTTLLNALAWLTSEAGRRDAAGHDRHHGTGPSRRPGRRAATSGTRWSCPGRACSR